MQSRNFQKLCGVFGGFFVIAVSLALSAGALAAEKTLYINEVRIAYILVSGEALISPSQAQWAEIDKKSSTGGMAVTSVFGLPDDAHTLAVRCAGSWFDKSGKRRRYDLFGYGAVAVTDRLLDQTVQDDGVVDVLINLFTLEVRIRHNSKTVSCAPNTTYIPYTLNTAAAYTVRSGDALSDIAPRYGTTWQQLITQNPHINNNGLLDAGQVIDVSYTPTDYSISDNWLNLSSAINKQVDVFYVYPTVYTAAQGDPLMADIDSKTMREAASKVYAEQAMLFADAGNLYAPYYRQISTNCLAGRSGDDLARLLAGMPAKDVIAAFDYYIKNYNKGRPFIVAGHSQGSNALEFLLSGYMAENPEILRRMVAAYIIGFSVTDTYLKDNPHLKFARSADDTGVIISYNTEMPGMTVNNPVVLHGALSINPLNWRTDGTYAPASLNRGALKVDAQVNLARGTVACSTVAPEDYLFLPDVFPYGCYHQCDYVFYGENLRQNALERVKRMTGEDSRVSGGGCHAVQANTIWNILLLIGCWRSQKVLGAFLSRGQNVRLGPLP